MPGEENKYPDLIFRVTQGLYCISSRYVISIAKLPKYHRIPGALEGVNGIIKFRDSVLPVIDLATMFGDNNSQVKSENLTESAAAKMMIVVKKESTQMGLIVDEVHMIEMLDEVQDKTDVLTFEHSGYIKTVKQRAGTDEIILEIEERELFHKFGAIPAGMLEDAADYAESEEVHNGRE